MSVTKATEEYVTKACAELELAHELGELMGHLLSVAHEFHLGEERKEFVRLVDRLQEMIHFQAVAQARTGLWSADDAFLQKVDDVCEEQVKEILGEDFKDSELMKELRRLT